MTLPPLAFASPTTAFKACIDIDGGNRRALAREQLNARATHAGRRRRDHRQFVL
jgi:hypothetical protein